ncbi:ATP-dependent zinc metalloprotease FtsH [Algoriphagus machipongonensis]|uniref:ATP-dependent zinc metalloprotease FtsH n=1 Tax=Algoriphagus machipongonensis TaxID=388413 RepID=A3I393_9BACT|nr:ATP-dependent zinc metalloprotease FtsH [Algoriphagus machipongonensis]EAZ79119.1 putative cell division protein FtsH [Algoriphagus machipongonensis]
MSDKNKNKKFVPKTPQQKPNFQLWLIIAAVLVLLGLTWLQNRSAVIDITQKKFEDMYLAGDVSKVMMVKNMERVDITLKPSVLSEPKYKNELESGSTFFNPSGPHYSFQVASVDKFANDFDALKEKASPENRIDLEVSTEENWSSYFSSFGFLILLFVFFWFMMRRMAGPSGPGGQIFNVGKSKAQLFDAENKVKITFDNVAGLDEAKEEIQEIVEFLKNPSKFTKLGGKIPKGALLVGPPGTGKTLLAKAVAGEAAVPFFTLSGSDFVEMFVGVGAARVRDLFKQAKEKAPCIIFIDEIDAIGRSRGKGQMPGSNDERENTLNSLLVEMDGFGTDSGVIVLAATNRPDVLDSALLRAGRFDRQISIDKPDIVGREAIFKVHLKPIKTNPDIDPKKLAAQTPGFAGAEIANVCNEAALIAARRNKTAVDMQDFQDAIDRTIGGLEKRNKIISPEEKKIVAYHEAGHAVAGWFLEHADPLVKVSIVPRGIAALGYAQYLPKEQFLYQTEQLIDEMCMTLGGRAAEEIIFKKISTGALSDLERVTKMAYSIVSIYGMNDKIGNVSFYDSKGDGYKMTKPYSETTAETIDEEVRQLVQKAYLRTKELLTERINELEILAKELLEKEILFQADLEKLIGKRPFERETTYQAYTNKKESAPVPVVDQLEEPTLDPDTTPSDKQKSVTEPKEENS